ncbi:MAG: S9 family peptidase, partial [Nitrospirota bacterium]
MKTACVILAALWGMMWVHPALAELPPIIPRDLLFGNPERGNPQLSPDGNYLAYTAPDEDGLMQIWIRTLGKDDDRMLTADAKRGIRRYSWAYNNEQLIYSVDSGGDEVWHAHAVEIRSGRVRDLTPFQGVWAQILGLSPKAPNEMLVGMSLDEPGRQDVYRVNLKNGAVEPDTVNPGRVARWLIDAQFRVRGAVSRAADGGQELLVREAADQPWRTVYRWGPSDQGEAVEFSADGARVYVTSDRDAPAKRLLSLDLATSAAAVIAEDPRYDIGGGEFELGWQLFHAGDHRLQAVGFYRDRLDWTILDKTIAADFAALAKIRKGQFAVTSRDLADRRWVIASNADVGPVRYYLYDRSSKKAELLFSEQSALESHALAAMKPIRFRSRDGLTLHGYLTTPAGVPAKRLPAVVLVHGGPWLRDLWGYHPEVQWLANRGYAVLRVNFRGSSGYGKEFLNAGNREWGGKMLDDLLDGVDWLVNNGIADPKRVAIMGRSFGGYSALAGLAFAPARFAAGVAANGPINLVSFVQQAPPAMKSLMARRVGDPEKDAEPLQSRSPFFFTDRINAPLLIGQGANDPRVKAAETERFVEALRAAKKPVDYLRYANEGH